MEWRLLIEYLKTGRPNNTRVNRFINETRSTDEVSVYPLVFKHLKDHVMHVLSYLAAEGPRNEWEQNLGCISSPYLS